MISSDMKKLAESIHANGEAIKVFRTRYIPALRSQSSAEDPSSNANTASKSSPAEHAQLIQGIMDNMDQIRTLASASEKRVALPIGSDCEMDFNIRGCSLLADLNEIPQSRILSAVRSQTKEVESFLEEAEKTEKILRNC